MTAAACAVGGCDGRVAADGYCDTCGTKAESTASSLPTASARFASATPPRTHSPTPPPTFTASTGHACTVVDCGGTVASDGYCDTCGTKSGPASTQTSTAPTLGAPSIAAAVAPSTSTRTGSTRRRGASTRSVATRSRLGAGLVHIEPTEVGDPAGAVMSQAEIDEVIDVTPEDERFCGSCENPVGRSSGDKAGRVKGFCSTCRTKFDFASNAPALSQGELVAGQYEVLGPIAHGGMGWIYLGQDKAVSDRWVVLKGLLDSNDTDAALAAVAERQFLAQIEQGNIVNIYNFVTHAGAGYIVMEYVGGSSLNSMLKKRRRANGGVPDPLPVADAIAYVLGILPAFTYLHRLGLVYNDLKPANIMAVGSDVKLIDVGAVMRMDDPDAAIFGTQGFQAPEMATVGPSIASDLYTVGRTLAVLVLNFVFHSGRYVHELPGPGDEPLFARWESLHRFLLKSTAPHPDDRFQSADEMAAQLTGVLRETVAVESGEPRPSTSRLFGTDRLPSLMLDDSGTDTSVADWRTLPQPLVDPNDVAAATIVDLRDVAAEQVVALLDDGVSSGQLPSSREVEFRRVLALLELGQPVGAVLDQLAEADPWDWRIEWYRAIEHLASDDPATAASHFSSVWTALPGELAPMLAVAHTSEEAGEFARAAQLYERVLAVDPTHVSAAFGLARSRLHLGDRDAGVAAFGRVPRSSATYQHAQASAARTLAAVGAQTAPSAQELAQAAATVERLQIDAAERAALTTDILEQALRADPSTLSKSVTIFGRELDERQLRVGLEAAYRERARLAATTDERIALVDRANEVRPRTFV